MCLPFGGSLKTIKELVLQVTRHSAPPHLTQPPGRW
jgi:hypothetical protein